MLAKFKSFYSDPYDPQMDALDWFLFIGFLLICLYLWGQIGRMFSAVSEI